MKKYLIAILLAGALLTTGTAMAQKHRHDPQVVTAYNEPDTMGIEAYSDTTSTDTAGTTMPVTVDSDDWDEDGFYVDHETLEALRNLLGFGVGGTVIAILSIIFILLVCLAPFLIIALVVWLIFKNRRQRYQLAEKAMESGQEIPQALVRDESKSDEMLWKRGIKNIFLGIGIAVLCYCLGADPLAGIGWLVSFCGVGQAVIAKTSVSKRNKRDDIDPLSPTSNPNDHF